MFRLAHISDVHLSPLPEPTWSQLASKRILGYLNWKRNRAGSLTHDYLDRLVRGMKDQNPDHIVVSGDLVNLALPQEFENAAAFLKSLGDPEAVSAICGNHDAYVAGGLEQAISSWQANMSGDSGSISNTVGFPYLRVRGEVAIIGCNSAEATAPFMATGYFRKAQAERLAEILKHTQGLCRIVCIHHPPIANATPKYKRLIGDDLFRSVIEECGAELVLHGHTHLATTYFIKSPGGEVPVVCVPAAGNGTGGKKPAGRFNLFEIEKVNSGYSIRHRAFGLSQTEETLDMLEQQEF